MIWHKNLALAKISVPGPESARACAEADFWEGALLIRQIREIRHF